MWDGAPALAESPAWRSLRGSPRPFRCVAIGKPGGFHTWTCTAAPPFNPSMVKHTRLQSEVRISRLVGVGVDHEDRLVPKMATVPNEKGRGSRRLSVGDSTRLRHWFAAETLARLDRSGRAHPFHASRRHRQTRRNCHRWAARAELIAVGLKALGDDGGFARGYCDSTASETAIVL